MNYYDVLGIKNNATEKEIKSAFRKLAKQYHPDVVKNDKAKTKKMYEIQEAYDVLSDGEKRKKYDESLLRQNNKSGTQTKKQAEGKEQKHVDFTKGTIFEQFFGFQAGKGMETYQSKATNKRNQGGICPDDLFTSFFGKK